MKVCEITRPGERCDVEIDTAAGRDGRGRRGGGRGTDGRTDGGVIRGQPPNPTPIIYLVSRPNSAINLPVCGDRARHADPDTASTGYLQIRRLPNPLFQSPIFVGQGETGH